MFGWFQNSFVGIERESPYNLSVGYLKGAEQADARLMLNVMENLGTARKHPHSMLQQNLCMGTASTWIFEQSLTLNDCLNYYYYCGLTEEQTKVMIMGLHIIIVSSHTYTKCPIYCIIIMYSYHYYRSI